MSLAAICADALGLGLRPAFYADLRAGCGVDFFEAIADNYLGPAALPRLHLRRAREVAPIVLHGVGLDLLGADPLDKGRLRALRALAEELDAPCLTDHLCWTTSRGRRSHDLLPAPWTPAVVRYAVDRVRRVQDALGRPFGIENLAAMLATTDDVAREADVLAEIVGRTGCGVLLDLNNLVVAARNLGGDPRALIEALRPGDVLYAHVAGQREPARGPVVDTHDAPVREEVWALYAAAWARLGPFPTVLEWDADVPPLAACVEEVSAARRWRGTGAPPAVAGRAPGVDGGADPGSSAPPAALVAWQEGLIGLLHAPPVWAPPRMRVATERYPAAVVARVRGDAGIDPIDRLRAYHEQVWFRWLSVVQAEHPTTAEVLGLWDFNRLATVHLSAWHARAALRGVALRGDEAAPGADIAEVADGFDRAVWGSIFDSPRARDALAWDGARREVMAALDTTPWSPPTDPEQLAEARLTLSPAARRVRRGGWGLQAGDPEGAMSAAWWLVVRAPGGSVVELDLAPELNFLMEAVETRPFGAALAALEETFPSPDLPERVQRWLAAAVRLGWWVSADSGRV